VKSKKGLRNCGRVLLILVVLLLSACEGQAMEEPQLKVSAGAQELRVIYYGDLYNETREEINQRLMQAMEDTSVEELPYVPLGEDIIINAENFQTEEFSLTDYILKENGEIRYQEKVAQTSEIPMNDGAATYTLISHPAAFLSSNSEDYEQGKAIRGIVVRADIEGSSFAFAFILRTDAGKFE
jgi:hypothetical protein